MRPPDLSGSANPSMVGAAAAATSTTTAGTGTTSETTDSSGAPLHPSKKKKKKPIKEILSSLQGFCSTKQTGYWMYEWCYERHVRQFHLEPQAAGAASSSSLPNGANLVTVAGTKYLKHPDWSLGGWKKVAHTSKAGRKKYLWPDTRQKGATKEPKFVSHLFIDGQQCDETNDNRRTEVRLVCCDETKKEGEEEKKKKTEEEKKKEVQKKEKVKPNVKGVKSAWHGVVIRSIQETSTCRYRMEVCVPLLCQRDDFRPLSMERPVPTPPTKEEILKKQMEVYHESQTQCVFYGLVWPRLLLENSPSYKWVASVTPIVGVRRER